MKEIKGRFWNGQRMIYWSLENMVKHGCVEFYENNRPVWHKNQMLFTGLSDKNGKEIFEGDILAYIQNSYDKKIGRNLGKAIIKWDNCSARFYAEWNGIKMNQILQNINTYYKIIGNIYENPLQETIF